MYIQEIIDVLYLALKKLESVFGKNSQSVAWFKSILKQQYSESFCELRNNTKS